MIFTVLSTATLGGLASYSYLQSNGSPKNDSKKILKILNNSGMKIRDSVTKKTETVRILRRRNIKDGIEYVFQIPLGLGQKDVQERKHLIEDGLNTKSRSMELSIRDVLGIKWDKRAWNYLQWYFCT
jgi:DNA segregation ATPase FtsK/SpoIIIE, S-DNA-T family